MRVILFSGQRPNPILRGIGGLLSIANEEDTRLDCDGPGAVFWGPAFVSFVLVLCLSCLVSLRIFFALCFFVLH